MELKFWIDEMISLNDKYHELNEADKARCREAVIKWYQQMVHFEDLKNVNLGAHL